VVELSKPAPPRGAAKVAEFTGVVRVELVGRERKSRSIGNDGEVQEESISIARHLHVEDGQEVEVGTPLHDGRSIQADDEVPRYPRDPAYLTEECRTSTATRVCRSTTSTSS